jgi:hypothetical protein
MPDLDLIKQAKQGARDRRGRFPKGRSGNPAGRPLTRKSRRAGARRRRGGITAVPRPHRRDARRIQGASPSPIEGEGDAAALSGCQSVDFRILRKPAQLFL